MSHSTFVAVNPASANGRTGKRWPELASALRAVLGDFDVGFTERSGHAPELVRRAVEAGARLIVSVGGDGTHNEVVNGMFRDGAPVRPDARLAIVPTGTGGDLRRTLALPRDAVEAIRAIGPRRRRVDVGHLRYTKPDGGPGEAYFINLASFGIPGLVDQYVNASSKALGGRVSFLIGAARAGARYRNQNVRLRLDDGEPIERKVNMIVAANGRYFGGGMHVAPAADMCDGLFDVVVVGDLSLTEMMRGLPRIYTGNHLQMGKIESMRARTVSAEPVDPDEAVLIDMDGEQPGRLPAALSLLPGALELHCGEGVDFGEDVPAEVSSAHG